MDARKEPLVSIIVATFNRGRYIERCVRSILNQTYRRIDCVVVDGASKDNSVEILERIAEQDSRLRFLSEPDDGEVYAVNKGLDLARGEIVGFQASDDYYTPDAVANSVGYLLRNPQHIGVSADAFYVDEHGQELGNGVITYRGEMSKRTIKRMIIDRYKMCPVCHGSFFGWKERLLRYGKLDPAFSVVPDWEYYFRLLASGETIGFIPEVHYMYTAHDDMGAFKHARKVEAQRQALFKKYAVSSFDRVNRATLGRLKSYVQNPYRTPLFRGVRRELREYFNKR